MATGVVLDTNILVHPKDENVYCYQTCCNVLNHLINSTEDFIYMDDGFSIDESTNGSPIGQEYLKHLDSGDLGYTCLLQLITDNRINFIPLKVEDNSIRKKIAALRIIPPDKRFVSLAYNSAHKVLVSEDLGDFTKERRREIRSKFEISVIQSDGIFQP